MQLPPISQPKHTKVEISRFRGVNNTDHPSTLKENVPTNLLNSYFNDGVLKKRNGYAQMGSDLTTKLTEEFTSTTNKDATNTTGDWTTDGAANLLTNTATVTSATYNIGIGANNQRTLVVASNGTIVMIYDDDTTALFAKKSTDKGATWVDLAGSAGETTIEASLNGSTFSMCIDGSDNIYVVYQAESGSMLYRKLTYSAGNWTVGDAVTAVAQSGAFTPYYCSIVVDSSDTIWIACQYTRDGEGSDFRVYKSTNGTDFTYTYIPATSTAYHPCLVLNNDKPVVFFSTVSGTTYKICASVYTTSWQTAVETTVGASVLSNLSAVCVSTDVMYVAYKAAGIHVQKFNGTAFSDTTTMSGGTSDTNPQLTTNGTNMYCVWSEYQSTVIYHIRYKYFNGSTWGDQGTILADNACNIFNHLPHTYGSILPLVHRTADSSPYNYNSRTYQLSGVIQSSGYDSGAVSQTYVCTPTTTLNGGTVSMQYADSADNNTFDDFSADQSLLTKRYIKFKATLTRTSLTTTPTLDSVEFAASGVSIISLHSWTRNDGTKYLLAVGGTNLYYYNGTDYKTIKTNLTTGLRTTAVPFGDYLIISNGTDVPIRFNGKVTTGTNVTIGGAGHTTVTGSGTKWNTASNADQLSAGGAIKIGTTWYTIASITSDTVLEITVAGSDGTYAYEAYGAPALAGTPPNGKYLAVHKNYVFIAGVAANPTRVYFSAVGDATSWTTSTDYLDVNTNDGEIINGLVEFKDVLQIHKSDSTGTRKSIQGIYGDHKLDFTLREITNQAAAVSQYATTSSPNGVYFVDKGGLYYTNGATVRKVDHSISTTTNTFSQAYLAYACATYFIQESTEFVFFSVPTGSSIVNDKLIVMDVETGDFALMDGINAGCFAIYSASSTPELYFGDQSNNSSVFKWNSGTDDDGQPIDWVVETCELNIKEYFNKKRFKYLYAFFESTGDYDVTASYALNGKTTYTALSETVATTSTDSEDVFKRWSLPALKGSSVRFKFEDDATGEPITMVRIALVAIDKGLRRI